MLKRSLTKSMAAVSALMTFAAAGPVLAGPVFSEGGAPQPLRLASMPLGQAARAPLGFLDFCRRSPAECAASGVSANEVQSSANSLYWSEVFRTRAQPSAPAALGRGARETRVDWSTVFVALPQVQVSTPALTSASASTRASASPSGAPMRYASQVPAQAGTLFQAPAQIQYPPQIRRPAPFQVQVPIQRPDPADELALVSPRALPLTSARSVEAQARAVTLRAMDLAKPARTTGRFAFTGVAPDVAPPVQASRPGLSDPHDPAAQQPRPVLAAAMAAARAAAQPAFAQGASPSATTVRLDKAKWALVNRVNRDVNRAIRRGSDERVFGVADRWQIPAEGGRGDCEDYVLAKRRELIRSGIPQAALSIAIVRTRWGESHAVLLLASDEGEVVLDNLTPWISRWDQVDYQWQERQRPGRVFEWVRMAS